MGGTGAKTRVYFEGHGIQYIMSTFPETLWCWSQTLVSGQVSAEGLLYPQADICFLI